MDIKLQFNALHTNHIVINKSESPHPPHRDHWSFHTTEKCIFADVVLITEYKDTIFETGERLNYKSSAIRVAIER